MKTVEIFTAQKVSIQYEVATLIERVLAWFIDFIIIWITAIVLNVVFYALLAQIPEYDGTPAVIVAIILSLPWFFYHYLFELLNHGRSIGKMALGLQVVKLSGENVQSHDYFIRWAFRLIDVVLSAGGLALILISTSNKGQRIGDALANTTVIRLRPRLNFRLKEIMEINTLESYQPAYPEVKNFSDKDMLMIKTVLERYREYHGQNEKDLLHEVVQNICRQLRLTPPEDEINFLKTLIKDYIVLTR